MYPESDTIEHENAGFWPPEVPTNISDLLTNLLPENSAILGWDAVKTTLRETTLGLEMDLSDDRVIERVLNDNGWEVLHTFDNM